MGKIIPVILCGGAGTRLAPLSNAENPKQFLNLVSPDRSLLQTTVERAISISDPDIIIIVTGIAHQKIIEDQLRSFDIKFHILFETASKNTAPAVALAANYAKNIFPPESLLFVMPCDAHIEENNALCSYIKTAAHEAKEGQIVLFGIKPDRPETGYGYIRKSRNSYAVDAFAEKPNLETAQAYVESGDYLWNSGMALFYTSTVILAFKNHAPDILANTDNYDILPSISFDVAILEKAANLSVIPCALKWSDIGTWNGLWQVLQAKQGISAVEGIKTRAKRLQL